MDNDIASKINSIRSTIYTWITTPWLSMAAKVSLPSFKMCNIVTMGLENKFDKNQALSSFEIFKACHFCLGGRDTMNKWKQRRTDLTLMISALMDALSLGDIITIAILRHSLVLMSQFITTKHSDWTRHFVFIQWKMENIQWNPKMVCPKILSLFIK